MSMSLNILPFIRILGCLLIWNLKEFQLRAIEEWHGNLNILSMLIQGVGYYIRPLYMMHPEI